MASNVSLWIWLEWYTDWTGSLRLESLVLRIGSINLFCDLGIESLLIAIAIPSSVVLDGLPRSVTSYSAFLYDRELIPYASDVRAQVGA